MNATLQVEKSGSKVTKMVLHYEDGTTKEIGQGIMIFQANDNIMSLQAIGLDGVEMIGMILGCTYSILQELGLPTDFIDRVDELAAGEEDE